MGRSGSIITGTRRGRLVTRLALAGALLAILGVVACGGGGQPVRAKWVPVQITGEMASLAVSSVGAGKIVHFELGKGQSGPIAFMAYRLGDQLYVRSNVCPPCQSVGFSLKGDTLVCDTCSTTFKAKTGDGISGACVRYPKAAVSYQVQNENIVMDRSAMLAAYQNTLSPGWP